jgi:hypothetical protein
MIDWVGRVCQNNRAETEKDKMSTRVSPEQFEISDKGITHKPTGCTFIPHPGQPLSGTMNDGQLGNKLVSGEDYRPSEVKAMMKELWTKHWLTKK